MIIYERVDYRLKNNKNLFIITLLYFALGIINIHFALLGFVCMFLPIILLVKNKKKTWCQGYCPRASLYTTCGKCVKKYSRRTPDFFTKGKMKWIMLSYFLFSLFNIVLSTVRVGMDKMEAVRVIRFLIYLPVIRNMPQLFDIDNILPWITHLSYSFYSMMFTTTILGLILALTFRPRTWCSICPIATVSGAYLKANTKKKGQV